MTEHAKIRNISDVAAWRLCVGCGACAYICPRRAVELVDFFWEGIRPVVAAAQCGDRCECLEVCPAVRTHFNASSEIPRRASAPSNDKNFQNDWGPVLEIWEGHAADESIRLKGSSGGALTALSAYCLEKLGMHGVLHIAQNPDDPLRNRTQMSRTVKELLAATGSRYSPASVCDHLEWVEQAPSPCVIIGKPVEIAALKNACSLRPSLEAKVAVTLSFFCAESPATAGTVALLNSIGVASESLVDLRYRGDGWPGHFKPTQKGEAEPIRKLTYRESWAFLQAYRPWSVHLWPDGTGELADISCGDPWYREPDGNAGLSLLLVRTERGRQIVHGAIEAGYLKLKLVEPWKLTKSQAGLLTKKGAVWGRLLAMRTFNLPVPCFTGLNLYRCWRALSLEDKLRSTLGTLRRIITRKLYHPLKLIRENDKLPKTARALVPLHD